MPASPHVRARVSSAGVFVRVHAAFMPFVRRLGTERILRQKLRFERTNGERENGRKTEKEERKGGEEEEEQRSTVTRIGFRTVSNDIGQDTTVAAQQWSCPRTRRILPSFFDFFLLRRPFGRMKPEVHSRGQKSREPREPKDSRRITRLRVCLMHTLCDLVFVEIPLENPENNFDPASR